MGMTSGPRGSLIYQKNIYPEYSDYSYTKHPLMKGWEVNEKNCLKKKHAKLEDHKSFCFSICKTFIMDI